MVVRVVGAVQGVAAKREQLVRKKKKKQHRSRRISRVSITAAPGRDDGRITSPILAGSARPPLSCSAASRKKASPGLKHLPCCTASLMTRAGSSQMAQRPRFHTLAVYKMISTHSCPAGAFLFFSAKSPTFTAAIACHDSCHPSMVEMKKKQAVAPSALDNRVSTDTAH